MAYYDEQLKQMHKQVSRKTHLDTALTQLYLQREELEQKVARLERVKIKEQSEADRLEGGSLSAFFYSVIGKKDEKLTKEREEAYAATVKFDAAVSELAAVEEDIRRKEEERRTLLGCEERYARLLEEKGSAIKASGGAGGEAIFRMEEECSRLANQKRELQEAIDAGEKAGSMVREVLESLEDAEGWCTWDMLGSGMIADLAKHEELDEAQRKIESLQIRLRQFRTELADVSISAEIRVKLDGLLSFADFFFDGLLVDWTVRDQIHRAQEQVEQARGQIEEVLGRLGAMLEQTEAEEQKTREELDELILKTAL